jgi:hypothetical protein
MTPMQARAFLAVAIEGSFTGAAKRLNLSQPSVTTRSDCSGLSDPPPVFDIGRSRAWGAIPIVQKAVTSASDKSSEQLTFIR